jgi:uncharacterized protein
MEVIGYIGAVLMGMLLGLIGGGGSILTVPILVYLFAVEPVLATAYSLFIVGLTSLIGSFGYLRRRLVHWGAVVGFGLPSVLSVFLTRLYLVPAIPDELFSVGGVGLTKPTFLLVLFAVVMLLAAASMLTKTRLKPSKPATSSPTPFNFPLILAEGLVVGLVTGLVGAGGGFLIIPALVVLARLPMKQAVGTSLVIIAAKSLVGFAADAGVAKGMDWGFLLAFSLVAVAGTVLGGQLSRRVSNEHLRPAFGWFVLVMGIYIIGKETFLK